ncbi:MAG: hypothetical protein RL091_1748 [Verrucomicrobiota bacterium]
MTHSHARELRLQPGASFLVDYEHPEFLRVVFMREVWAVAP